MVCTIIKGGECDTVQFSRGGVRGSLEVREDRIDLHAKLGLLLGAFSQSIEAEIGRQLDAELLKVAEGKSPDRKR
jgi:putative polyhydroxyalkanoate system protein